LEVNAAHYLLAVRDVAEIGVLRRDHRLFELVRERLGRHNPEFGGGLLCREQSDESFEDGHFNLSGF